MRMGLIGLVTAGLLLGCSQAQQGQRSNEVNPPAQILAVTDAASPNPVSAATAICANLTPGWAKRARPR